MSDPPVFRRPNLESEKQQIASGPGNRNAEKKDETAEFCSVVEQKIAALKVGGKKTSSSPGFAGTTGRISPSFQAAGYSSPRVPYFIQDTTSGTQSGQKQSGPTQSGSATKHRSPSPTPRVHRCEVRGCSLNHEVVARSPSPQAEVRNSSAQTSSQPPDQPPVIVHVYQPPPPPQNVEPEKCEPTTVNCRGNCGLQSAPSQPAPSFDLQPKAMGFTPISQADEWSQLTRQRLAQQPSVQPSVPSTQISSIQQEPIDGERWSTRTNVIKTHHAPGKPCTIVGMQSLRSQEPGRHENWAKVVKTQQGPGPTGQLTTTTGFYGVLKQDTPGPEALLSSENAQLSSSSGIPQEELSASDLFLQQWKAGVEKSTDQ